MKKILFTAYSLDIGGIERALITLLNSIDYSKYDVTLILEHKEGAYLGEVPSCVNIIEYRISNCSFMPFRKIKNRLKLITEIILNYHKYDFSCCYATYSIPGASIAKYFSSNNAIWIHADYYYTYNKDDNKIKKFFNERSISSFKHIIFVSNEALNHFKDYYPELSNCLVACNNLIDAKYVISKAKEKIKEQKPNRPLLINISRHEEVSKRLSRLIEASSLLKKANYDFEIWLIGKGDDSKYYEELIAKLNLQDNIKMLGFKKNPYPYYRLADATILTSDYEGFPVVYLESIIFGVPIITTIDVSTDELKIKDNYGFIAKKNVKDIYLKIKYFIDNKYQIDSRFDADKYNNVLRKKIENMFNNKWW